MIESQTIFMIPIWVQNIWLIGGVVAVLLILAEYLSFFLEPKEKKRWPK
jgi:hypothetical protein